MECEEGEEMEERVTENMMWKNMKGEKDSNGYLPRREENEVNMIVAISECNIA
jgi:hypothetical protein